MRVALIADIHGNLVALEAVLADIDGQRVDEVVCLGDIASDGPHPREVVDRIRALGCPVVMGNADEEMIDSAHVPSAWFRDQLAPDLLSFLETLPPTVRLSLGPGETVLCFHGSPRSYHDLIMSTTPTAELASMLDGCHASILAGGHTHVQMVRRYRKMLIVNPGSVGLPYDKNPWTGEVPPEEVRLAPWSEYAIVTCHDGRLAVELRRVPLHLPALTDAALASGWPGARDWVQSWIAGR